MISGISEVTPKTSAEYSKNGFDSVKLNGGFTTCFWVYVSKLSPEQHSSILYQWKNASDYDFQVGFKNEGVYVAVRNQSDDVEKILSEK